MKKGISWPQAFKLFKTNINYAAKLCENIIQSENTLLGFLMNSYKDAKSS